MGDDHRRAAALLVALDRAGERHRAFGVEVRIRLVHHHHHGRAVKRPGQRDPLALATGERRAARRDLEIVAARQLEDHLVRSGPLRRLHDILVLRPGREAGDVLRHRPLEQDHLLRQVADMPPEQRSVMLEFRPVEPHRARQRPVHAGQRPGQRGLARSRGAGNPRRPARLQPERGAAHRRHRRTRSGDGQPLHFQDRARHRERGPLPFRRRLLQQRRQRTPRRQHPLQLRPLSHRLVDRRERPPQKDRRRDDDAEGHKALDREPRAETQHHRLQEQPERFRGDAEKAAPVRGRQRPFEHAIAQCAGARDDRILHAEPLHGFAARAHLLDKMRRACRGLPELPLETPGARLVEQGEHQQQAAGKYRQKPQKPVEHEQHRQEHRRPGRIEKCERPGTGREALNRLEVAQSRRRPRPLRRRDRAREDRSQDPRVQPRLQPRPGPGQNPAPRIIENAHHQEQERGDRRQRRQRRLRARGQHPVVNLQHEKRPGQHQQVDENAEKAHRQKQTPALRQRRAKLPVAAVGLRHRPLLRRLPPRRKRAATGPVPQPAILATARQAVMRGPPALVSGSTSIRNPYCAARKTVFEMIEAVRNIQTVGTRSRDRRTGSRMQ